MPYKNKDIARRKALEYERRRYRKSVGIPEDGFPEKACEFCGTGFQPKRASQRFCNTTCYDNSTRRNETRQARRHALSADGPMLILKHLLLQNERSKTLCIDDLVNLWNAQNGKCAISGQPMTHILGSGKHLTNVSIDRIDPSRGYEKDNIRLVCRLCNIMRHTLSDEELFDWCKIILNHNKETLNGGPIQ